MFKSNDLIGQVVIDLEELFSDGELAKRGMSLTKDYYDEYLVAEKGWKKDTLTFDKDEPRHFWVNFMGKDKDSGKEVFMGKLKLQIDILPKKDALASPVGAA